MQHSITLHSYAKINLGLRILRKRPDGYHDIETIFYEVHPFDVLTLTEHATIEFHTDHPSLSSDDSNLCIRAARLLQQKFDIQKGVHIELKKTIPLGAGLGGGSSNAAATLVGLNKLWNLHCSSQQLEHLAAQLGSDVPFFIRGGCALATGRGERLSHVHVTVPYWILVATPPVHVSTAWAYTALNFLDSREPHYAHVVSELLSNNLDALLTMTNDFEPIVFDHFPAIRKLKEFFTVQGALFTLMSGSGSSVFGFFPDRETAERVQSNLPTNVVSFLTPPNFSARIHE